MKNFIGKVARGDPTEELCFREWERRDPIDPRDTEFRKPDGDGKEWPIV